jgi:hypothetical protein
MLNVRHPRSRNKVDATATSGYFVKNIVWTKDIPNYSYFCCWYHQTLEREIAPVRELWVLFSLVSTLVPFSLCRMDSTVYSK